MAVKCKGQTFIFENPPHIVAHAAIVGPEESKGPYSDYFDLHLDDAKYGEDSWKKVREDGCKCGKPLSG